MQPAYAIPFPRLDAGIYSQIGDTARRFAETRVRPIAHELDETESFPAALYGEMAGLGLFGITVPEDYGGAGLDALSYAIVMEELARGYASVADQCGLVELIATLLSVHGSAAQRAAHLADVLAARKRVA
jgi:alkylation response protein AidB-like acyl-CoA dehydrogenase